MIGSFDGALTILGLILGAYFAGAGSSQVPLIAGAGISAATALAISSVAGAYEIERVEKKLEKRKVERALLTQMSEGHREAYRFAAWISALVHGAAPLTAALIPLIPFYIVPDFFWATITASIAAFSVLFVTGVYLGKLVDEFLVYTGFRFVLVGLATAAIALILSQGL